VIAGNENHAVVARKFMSSKMTSFHSFSGFAASRSEGLHSKLQALFERAAASPFSVVAMPHDGLIQAGLNPDSEIVPSRENVILFSR